jgi:tetratricopeptide (TPR) repeat protein
MLYRPQNEPKAAQRATHDDLAWRQLTQDANAAYQAGDHERARELYDAALEEAEALFEAAYGKEIQAPVAVLLVISSHNRADLARREGNVRMAHILALGACEQLMTAAEDVMAPLKLRTQAVQNTSKAIAYLADLARSDAAAQAILPEAIARARHAAFAVFKVAEHARFAQTGCGVRCDLFQ